MPTEEAAPLSAEDQPFYDAVKREFGDRCAEDMALRVARAFAHKKNRLQTTLDETRSILEWRDKLQVDSVLTRELDCTKIYYECWPGLMYGEDSEGHLIAIDRISDISLEGFLANFQHVDALLPHRAQYMERIQWEKAAISRRLGRRVYKHICVVDLRGLGMKHVSRSMLNHLKPIFDVGQRYYPETLHRLYLVNAPIVFYGAWKIISTLIDPDTREKIQVFKDSPGFLEAAQKHGIPLTALPSYLGGSHPGRPMNSTFRPSDPDTPLPIAAASTGILTATEHVVPAEVQEQPVPASPAAAEQVPVS